MSQKQNGWLVGYGVASALILGGAGYYWYTNLNNYNEKVEGYQSNTGSITTLLKKAPQPNKKNVAALEKELSTYEADIKELFTSLQTYQKPLLALDQADESRFQQELPATVKGFLAHAKEKGLEVDGADAFFMGMGSYQSTLPLAKDLVPLLDYQLKASDRLLRILADSGVSKLVFFSREPLAGEFEADLEKRAAAQKQVEEQVVRKYPLTIQFEGTHESMQRFFNNLASDSEYFFILRATRIENSAPKGPTANLGGSKYRGADGKDVAPEQADAILKDVPPEELNTKLGELGWTVVAEDARILFGNETMKVFVVIDAARFKEPSSEVAPVEKKAPAKKK